MNRLVLIFVGVWLGFSPVANAKAKKKVATPPPAEAPETVAPAASSPALDPIPEKSDAANKAPGEDVDEVLTNKKMRAESGSKSKLSISNSINWSGSTIEHPFAEDRPNITGGTGATTWASLRDQISGKYNLDQRHAILAGFGARWITPFNRSKVPAAQNKAPYNGTKVDAYDPYVQYQYIYKWLGIQSVLVGGATYTTQQNLVNDGYVGNITIQQNNAYDIGHTGLTIGLLGAVTFTGYKNRDDLSGTSDYSFGLYPFLEYTINDRFNLRTISGVWLFEHLRSENRPDTFYKNGIYQSVGLGISVMRDFYLYPNIQFLPENIRADLTNVAISANINLF